MRYLTLLFIKCAYKMYNKYMIEVYTLYMGGYINYVKKCL